LTLFRPLCYKVSDIDNWRGDLRQLAPRKKTAKEPLGFREIFQRPCALLRRGVFDFPRLAFEIPPYISPREPKEERGTDFSLFCLRTD
jgi:hypothetical protein